MGRKIGLRNRLLLQEDMGNDQQSGIIGVLKSICAFTFAVEFVGANILVKKLCGNAAHIFKKEKISAQVQQLKMMRLAG